MATIDKPTVYILCSEFEPDAVRPMVGSRRTRPGARPANRSLSCSRKERRNGRTATSSLLRDYINATIGFEELGRRTKRPAKSLMRMLGPTGNPQARNLLEVIGHLQRAEGLHFELSLRAAS